MSFVTIFMYLLLIVELLDRSVFCSGINKSTLNFSAKIVETTSKTIIISRTTKNYYSNKNTLNTTIRLNSTAANIISQAAIAKYLDNDKISDPSTQEFKTKLLSSIQKTNYNIKRKQSYPIRNYHKVFEVKTLKQYMPNTKQSKKTQYIIPVCKNCFLECLTCETNMSTSYKDYKACYKGLSLPVQRCSKHQQCFTEMHPKYVRRGCIGSKDLARIFVCSCPMCNNKPLQYLTNFNYHRIEDWQYHNDLIQIGFFNQANTICRRCESIRNNILNFTDTSCLYGNGSTFQICEQNQVCFTNITPTNIKRGFIDLPAYNPMYFYCDTDNCNTIPIDIPRKHSERRVLKLDFASFDIPDDIDELHDCTKVHKLNLFLISLIIIFTQHSTFNLFGA